MKLPAGSLRQYFSLIATKRLRDSEVNPATSHSHEFNGRRVLKDFLGRTPHGKFKRFGCRFLYFSDEQEQPDAADSQLTWYKPHSNPGRDEWRLYYEDNPIVGGQGNAKRGDLMVFGFSASAQQAPELDKNDSAPTRGIQVWAVIAKDGSSAKREISRLFGVNGEPSEQLELHEPPAVDLDFVGRQLLDGLGIEVQLPQDWEERLKEEFGATMPDVVTFSNFAASTLELDPAGDPDASLVAWWEREDLLFRIHERANLQRAVTEQFESFRRNASINVEALRKLFMSSMQKSKSRAGGAFENQIGSILRSNSLRFDSRKRTPTGDIPDFLFPGLREYETTERTDLLTMLAAKTTCRERWQQVLAEAPRVPRKHLATLRGDLPPDQFQRMRDASLTLVLPTSRHSTIPAGVVDVITLRSFIELVRSRQRQFG